MTGTRTVLVPLDGSAFAEQALPVALGIAQNMGAQLVLVSVLGEEPLIPFEDRVATERLVWYHQSLVDRIGKAWDVSVSSKILSGPVVKRLQRHVKDSRPDLVVMSTHGRGPLSRAWLGSVADHLVRRVSTPVLLIRPDQDAAVDLGTHNHFERILVPLDGSERAEASLEWATQIGRATKASYTLLQVVPLRLVPESPYLPHAVTESRAAQDGARQEADTYVRRRAGELRYNGFSVDTEVLVGIQPATGILRCAGEKDTDLIVMGTHGRGGLSRLMLGSVADKIVRAAPVPVLLTRVSHDGMRQAALRRESGLAVK